MTLTELILVRHGESLGNVASAQAEAAGAQTIDIAERDPDVVLSARGREQAEGLGRWLGGLTSDERPQAVVTSTYVRARTTAEIALATAGLHLPVRSDDRFRDRELGVLDRLTARGVEARFPAEAQRRRHLGKLYYRPPGGESWTDVALRLRSVLAELEAGPESRLLVACHDAVILLIRYVLERLDETSLMAIATAEPMRNAAVTRMRRDGRSGWRTVMHNDATHLRAAGAGVTEHPGRRDER